MLKKIIIMFFALGFFFWPFFAFAAEEGTLVFSVADAKGNHPASIIRIQNNATDEIITRVISKDAYPAKFTLPVGGYNLTISPDQSGEGVDYAAPDVMNVAIIAGQERAVSANLTFSSGLSGVGDEDGAATAGSSGNASSGGTFTGGGAASGSGTLSIGNLKFAAPAVFTTFTTFGDRFKRLETAIPALFDIAVYAASIIFIILFVVGGIQYLTSAGNEEATSKAKKLLVDAVIGLIIVLASWAAGTWILANLGVR